jgi:hypothetical protein
MVGLISWSAALVAAAILVPWVWVASNLVAAKLIGAPVSRAGLGVGPVMFRFRWGDTACHHCWIPSP